MYVIRLNDGQFVAMYDFGDDVVTTTPTQDQAMTIVNRENADFLASKIPGARVENFKIPVDATA